MAAKHSMIFWFTSGENDRKGVICYLLIWVPQLALLGAHDTGRRQYLSALTNVTILNDDARGIYNVSICKQGDGYY
jgi:hypothetical protein